MGYSSRVSHFLSKPVALAICCLLSFSAEGRSSELTVDQVVAKAIEALGGLDRWDQVQSLRYSGSFSTFSSSRPFQIQRKRPNLYRFDHYFGDGERTLAFDGETAWWLNLALAARVPWPEETPIADAIEILGDAEFGSPLLDYQQKGHRVTLEGLTDYDGEPAWEVKIHLAHGGVETWYFDPQTFLPVVRISSGSDLRQPTTKKVFFLAYQEFDGLVLPHRMDIELGFRYQSLEVEKVEINPEIADDLFRMPLPEGLKALGNLAGPWEVEIESRIQPGMPWLPSRASTSWTSLDQGNLLTESLTFVDFGSYRRITRWMTFDQFRRVYQVHRYNNLTHHVEVLEGTFEDNRLVLTNETTSSSWSLGGETFHTREVIYEIGPSSFKIDLESSTDGGETWVPMTRFAYHRPADPREAAQQ